MEKDVIELKRELNSQWEESKRKVSSKILCKGLKVTLRSLIYLIPSEA